MTKTAVVLSPIEVMVKPIVLFDRKFGLCIAIKRSDGLIVTYNCRLTDDCYDGASVCLLRLIRPCSNIKRIGKIDSFCSSQA